MACSEDRHWIPSSTPISWIMDTTRLNSTKESISTRVSPCKLNSFVEYHYYSPLHQDSSFSFSPLHQNSETSLCCTCLFHQRLGNLALPHYEIDTISVKQTGATTFPKITDRPFPGPWGISHSPHEGRAS